MKKLIFILLITFASCSKPDEDCSGTAKYILENGSYFYVPNTPKDCDTGECLQYHPSGFFVGFID